eukprot:11699815-Karenia_brevis.AAC.1
MLVDLHERFTRQQLGALKLSLDWTPVILGDGHTVGSFVQKYYLEQCNTMPLRDGQWYLLPSPMARRFGCALRA